MNESTLVNFWPVWLAVVLTLITAFHQMVTSSEKVANVLGRFGKWMYARARKRYLLDVEEFNDALTKAVQDARAKWEADEARALAVVSERLEYMTKLVDSQQDELVELNFGHRCTLSYIEYEADWHHKLQMMIITCGSKIAVDAIPLHVPYHDFERQCKETGSTNWRQWYYGSKN